MRDEEKFDKVKGRLEAVSKELAAVENLMSTAAAAAASEPKEEKARLQRRLRDSKPKSKQTAALAHNIDRTTKALER